MNEVIQKLLFIVAVIAIYSLNFPKIGLLAQDRSWPVVDEMPKKPVGINTTGHVGDIVSFYPKPASLMLIQEKIDTKIIECSKSLGFFSGYFTLARPEDSQAVLFAITAKGPVTNIEQIFPEGEADTTLDWGYVYDRNGDGWVDYFIYLDNALPVKTEEIAHLIPSRPEVKYGDSVPITIEELKLRIKHSKLVFTHNADDNFDGKTDGVVVALWDSGNPMWIYGNGLLRSSSYTQKIDEAWRFFSDIKNREGQVPRTPEGYYNISFYMGGNPLEMSSDLLKSINKGIRKCRLPKGILPKE